MFKKTIFVVTAVSYIVLLIHNVQNSMHREFLVAVTHIFFFSLIFECVHISYACLKSEVTKLCITKISAKILVFGVIMTFYSDFTRFAPSVLSSTFLIIFCQQFSYCCWLDFFTGQQILVEVPHLTNEVFKEIAISQNQYYITQMDLKKICQQQGLDFQLIFERAKIIHSMYTK
jgi:hypothetical protein